MLENQNSIDENEPTIGEKIESVKHGIKQISIGIYDLTIAAQAAKAVGNSEAIPNIQKGIEMQMKTLDFYRSKLVGLEKARVEKEVVKNKDNA